MMTVNKTPHEMSLQEKAICLALAGRRPELPYPLKEIECADGTVQRIYEIPDADKAGMLADLYPFDGGAPSIDDTLFDLHERKTFKVRNFLVVRWCEGNLLASPYFQRSGGMMVDWIDLAKVEGNGTIVDVRVARAKNGGLY